MDRTASEEGNNIKMYFMEIDYVDGSWVELVQERRIILKWTSGT
jgi:hypothetical protein